MTIKKCVEGCYSPFQDKRYGAMRRSAVPTSDPDTWRCTVCGKDITKDRPSIFKRTAKVVTKKKKKGRR